jgi:glycosyltransferase involved in cell wall biosynthesis
MTRILYLTKTLQWHSINKVIYTLATQLRGNMFEPHVCALFDDRAQDSPLRNNSALPATSLGAHSRFSTATLRKLIAYCRAHDIRIIHAHYPLLHFYAVAAARVLRLPAVFTSHDDDNWSLRLSRFAPTLFMYGSLPFTRRVVAVSKELQGRIKWQPGHKISTIYNGVDLSAYENVRPCEADALRRELTEGRETPLIGTVTRLFQKKGVDVLIKAARMLKQRGENFRAIIAGEGPLREEYVKLAAAERVETQIKFLGYREDVPRLLAALDVFVLPSFWEGNSIALLEAMAAAKPIIATRVGGNPEAITEGETGWLVPPNDAAALAEKILAVLGNEHRARIGLNAREHWRANFSVAAMVEKYQALYLSCLGNSL